MTWFYPIVYRVRPDGQQRVIWFPVESGLGIGENERLESRYHESGHAPDESEETGNVGGIVAGVQVVEQRPLHGKPGLETGAQEGGQDAEAQERLLVDEQNWEEGGGRGRERERSHDALWSGRGPF